MNPLQDGILLVENRDYGIPGNEVSRKVGKLDPIRELIWSERDSIEQGPVTAHGQRQGAAPAKVAADAAGRGNARVARQRGRRDRVQGRRGRRYHSQGIRLHPGRRRVALRHAPGRTARAGSRPARQPGRGGRVGDALFVSELRVRPVPGHSGLSEMSWGDTGRAAFSYGTECVPRRAAP